MIPEPLARLRGRRKCRHRSRKTKRGEDRFGVGQFLLVECSRIKDLLIRDPGRLPAARKAATLESRVLTGQRDVRPNGCWRLEPSLHGATSPR
ncbi:MAG: hypothetical protein QOI22_1773 [Verrucomicrobiota bacterium]